MHIVFFEPIPLIRIRKQVEGLRKSGSHKLTFITIGANWSDEYRGLFDRVIDFAPYFRYNLPVRAFRKGMNLLFGLDRRLLARIIRKLDCDIIHAYGRDNVLVQTIVENTKTPVIYDAQDFAGVRYDVEALPARERAAEKFCLEHVNGIVTKFPPEVVNYYYELGYQIKAPVLHYEDYCSEEQMMPLDVYQPKPPEWHLVFTGTIAPASYPRDKYGYMQFHDMARILAKQKIHFHIYPSLYQQSYHKLFGCYLKLEKEIPYFHFHRTVTYNLLSQEISQYHWGAWIHPPVADSLGKYAWYGIGTKVISYIEAGLPVVINQDVLWGSKLVQENGIGCVFDYADISRLGEILNEVNWSTLRQNLEQFRMRYSTGNQASRLVEFYEQVIAQGSRL